MGSKTHSTSTKTVRARSDDRTDRSRSCSSSSSTANKKRNDDSDTSESDSDASNSDVDSDTESSAKDGTTKRTKPKKVILTPADQAAGLSIPSGKIKRLMIAYWESKDSDEDRAPTLRNNIQYHMSSILGDMIGLIARSSSSTAMKNDMKMYVIEESDIRSGIRNTTDLRKLFQSQLEYYKPSTNYTESSVLNGTELDHAIGGVQHKYMFGTTGRNMICYLIDDLFNETMAALRSLKESGLFSDKLASINSKMLYAVYSVWSHRTIYAPLQKTANERINNMVEYFAQHRKELDDKRLSEQSDDDEQSSSSSKKKTKTHTSSSSSKRSTTTSSDTDDTDDDASHSKKTKKEEKVKAKKKKNKHADDDDDSS